MPRFGTLDLSTREPFIREIEGFGTEPWTLKNTEIFYLSGEIEEAPGDSLLPPAMHPTIPPYAVLCVMKCSESPVGPFAIGEVRVVGRAGVRPRAFVLKSVVDSGPAREALAKRWGFPTAPGEIRIKSRHDRITVAVLENGSPILEAEMLDRDIISGKDLQYPASMHLARSREDGKAVLVQVDPEYVFSSAERGRPRILSLNTHAWGASPGLVFTDLIAASYATADVTLPRIRYVVDPTTPALRGTRKLAA